MISEALGVAGGIYVFSADDGALGCGLDVQTGGEGFGTGACEQNGADGWVGGELLEDFGEVEPHPGGGGCQ